ncbi:hypothetical protein [Candidatus Nitrosoglobus terrae]|uniref:hypothetical protein n=1 Tax=Candidatus Nitrosoglobus terrae TaxID=1630141 RepID=UPI000BBA7258|nr:hypothetical protein [Candidatus Nitrosoglobus terrae]
MSSVTLDSSSGSLTGIFHTNNIFAGDLFLIQQTADPDLYLIITQQLLQSPQYRVGIYLYRGFKSPDWNIHFS